MTDPGTISVQAAARRRGREIEVALTAQIPPDTHIESHEPPEPFLIPTVVEAEGLEAPTVAYPQPVRKDLGISDVMLSVYEGEVRFVVRGEAEAGVSRLGGAIRYQPCVNAACLPPRTAAWEAPVPADGGT